MISPTGRIPASAAPVIAPAMPYSLIGVSMMRSAPKCSTMPRVTPKVPP